MDFKGLVCLLVLYISKASGAALPQPADESHQMFDYHFNQKGVHFGLKLDNKLVPLMGGEILAEFPVHSIFKLIEGEPTLFKKMFIPFKVELLERLRDVLTVKAIITYKGEHYKSGIFVTNIKYTIFHADHTEVTGTFHAGSYMVKDNEFNIIVNNKVIMKSKMNIQDHLLKAKVNFDLLEEYKGTVYLDYDRVNKNDIFHKFKFTGSVTKMDEQVFEFVIDTFPTPYHFSVFYPLVFQRMFNKPMERLTLDVHHVVTGEDHALTFTTNYKDLVLMVEYYKKRGKLDHRTFYTQHHQLSAKMIKHDVTYVEFDLEPKLFSNDRYLLLNMKPKLHFHADSHIHKQLCQFSSHLCFTELVGDVHIEYSRMEGHDIKVTVNKDTAEIFHLSFSTKIIDQYPPQPEKPLKLIFRSSHLVPMFKYMSGQTVMMPVLKPPFDITVIYDPEEYLKPKNIDMHLKYIGGQTWVTGRMPVHKSPFEITVTYAREDYLMLETNIDMHENMIKISRSRTHDMMIELNHEVVAEFDFDFRDNNFEVFTTRKDGTQLKTVVTWDRRYSYIENTVTVTMMNKDVPQVETTIEWNVRDLTHGTVMVDVVGKKVQMFGDFKFQRNIKWDLMNAHEFEIVLDGKTSPIIMETLATPIVTDAKITNNNSDVQVKIEGVFDAKAFSLIFSTKPFKFALLPIFEVEA